MQKEGFTSQLPQKITIWVGRAAGRVYPDAIWLLPLRRVASAGTGPGTPGSPAPVFHAAVPEDKPCEPPEKEAGILWDAV